MRVLGTKRLVVAHSFSFGGTSYERPKNISKWHLQRNVLGTSSESEFKHFPYNRFYGSFTIFPDAKCIPDIAEPK